MSRISFFLFLTTVLLSVIGLFWIYESSSYTALFYLKDKYYYINNQLVWFAIGIILSLIISRYDYKKLYYAALPLLIMSFFLLFAVFFPGIGLELKGAHRWLNLKFLVFQPSEFLKISLTLYLAAWLSNKEKNRFLAFLIVFIFSIFIIAIEPDLGTALIVAVTSILVYFLSGAKISEMLMIFLFLVISSIVFIKIEPYRIERLTSFQNFSVKSFSGAPYHIKQILIAIGSGGLTGVGLGNSIQKYAYLPESTTDSIFAIFAEETGFVGSVLLIFLFIFYIFLGFLISIRTKSSFARLLSSGIVIFIGVQTFLNLSSQVVLTPLAGVPLPFISYGGSSMVINFLSVGILMNIGNKISK